MTAHPRSAGRGSAEGRHAPRMLFHVRRAKRTYEAISAAWNVKEEVRGLLLYYQRSGVNLAQLEREVRMSDAERDLLAKEYPDDALVIGEIQRKRSETWELLRKLIEEKT